MLRFVFVTTLVYVVLMFPWPGSDRVLGAVCRACGTGVVRILGMSGTTSVEPAAAQDPRFDSVIRLASRPEGVPVARVRSLHVPLATGGLCLSPIVLFVALVIATPVPVRDRCRALLLGAPILAFFVVARVMFMVLTELIQRDAVSDFVTQPFWSRTVDFLGLDSGSHWLRRSSAFGRSLLCGGTMTSLLMPVVIWAAVCVGRADWPGARRGGDDAARPGY